MTRKKTFVNSTDIHDDPALSFISMESAKPMQEHSDDSPISPSIRPESFRGHTEVKSRRVQLVMQPSLYKKVKRASAQAGLSFNEYCHRVLERATSGNLD